MRLSKSRFLPIVLLQLSFQLPLAPAFAADSAGSEYWLAMPRNVPDPTEARALRIVAAAPASGMVTSAAFGLSVPFEVAPGVETVVPLPAGIQVEANDAIEGKGIHVTASAPVSVFGFTQRTYSSDGYLGLPVDALGTRYVLMAWGAGLGAGSQLVVAAAHDDTLVTITPSVAAGPRPAGVPFAITLQAGETYLLHASGDGDLTGSLIDADRPVSVFGGHTCAQVPDLSTDFCDVAIEQMAPVAAWGSEFLVEPFAARTGGDVVRVLAAHDDTVVFVGDTQVAILGAGEVHPFTLTVPAHIRTSKPASVAQFAKGLHGDGNPPAPDAVGDPSMSMIAPVERYRASHRFAVAPGSGELQHFVNVVVPIAAVASVVLDGVPVPAEQFAPIDDGGYAGARLSTTPGAHAIAAAAPIGVTVYGFRRAEGYAYPAGTLIATLDVSLSVHKSVAQSEVAPGEEVVYTIVVANDGPDDAIGASVRDLLPAGFDEAQWSCTPSPGAACTASGEGDIDDDLVALPAGGSLTYTVTARAPVTPGAYVNAASVTAPINARDATPDDDSSSAGLVVSAPAPASARPVPASSPAALVALAVLVAGLAARRRARATEPHGRR